MSAHAPLLEPYEFLLLIGFSADKTNFSLQGVCQLRRQWQEGTFQFCATKWLTTPNLSSFHLSLGSLTDSNIREEFLDFQSTERITGEVISQLILGKLEQWGLDISHYRGQDYDSASNMSSQARGIQGLISRKTSKPCAYTAIRMFLISLL